MSARACSLVLALALGVSACGSSSPTPKATTTASTRSPTTVVVTADDTARVAHVAAAVAAIEAYAKVVAKATRSNLRHVAPALVAARTAFARELQAAAADPTFDPARLVAWRALDAAMAAVARAAQRGDPEAFLVADTALINASAAAS
jgi:hypothetical protein